MTPFFMISYQRKRYTKKNKNKQILISTIHYSSIIDIFRFSLHNKIGVVLQKKKRKNSTKFYYLWFKNIKMNLWIIKDDRVVVKYYWRIKFSQEMALHSNGKYDCSYISFSAMYPNGYIIEEFHSRVKHCWRIYYDGGRLQFREQLQLSEDVAKDIKVVVSSGVFKRNQRTRANRYSLRGFCELCNAISSSCSVVSIETLSLRHPPSKQQDQSLITT